MVNGLQHSIFSRKRTYEKRKINDGIIKTYKIDSFNSQSFIRTRVELPLVEKYNQYLWLCLRKSSNSSHLKEDRKKLNPSSAKWPLAQAIVFYKPGN